MPNDLLHLIPADGTKILLVLFLSFLIGLDREGKINPDRYSFGGVRTFPLIGLIGYVMALLSGSQLIAVALGLSVVGALLVVSYTHELSTENPSGVTTEVSALGAYLLGALVYHDQLWIATTITVISMFLQVLKTSLEGLTQRVPPDEIFTFTKFLLLTAVILPVLPRAEFTQFQINPFNTWLVVVAVSSVSYGSYLLLKVTRGRNGVLLSALLGGAYSSTVTTIALARRSVSEDRPRLFSGGTLMASGMMYLRLALLLTLFNHTLLGVLGIPFILLLGGVSGMVMVPYSGFGGAHQRSETRTRKPAGVASRAAVRCSLRNHDDRHTLGCGVFGTQRHIRSRRDHGTRGCRPLHPWRRSLGCARYSRDRSGGGNRCGGSEQ